MRRFFLQTNRPASWLMRTALGGLMAIMITGACFTFEPRRAEAYELPVVDIIVWIESAVSAIADYASEVLLYSLEYKEYILDDIAYTLAKIAMEEITNSTIRWINSGFKGSPAFVTDLDRFLVNTADKAAGEFIYGSGLDFLCSPFQLDVRIALQLSYDAINRDVARCTLSDVVGNVEDFFNDPLVGGIDGWFTLTVRPNNNFFSAYDTSQEALREKLALQREINLNELMWGSGFLSKEECTTVSDTDEFGETYDEWEECSIVTPGDTISEALTFELSTGSRTLIEADEINEIISALFTQLSLKALEGAGGLLGLSRTGGDYGETAYLDRINNPKFDKVPGSNAIREDMLSKPIRDEEQFNKLYADLVAKADRIIERIEELEALEANEEDDEEWVCSDMSGLRARAAAIRAEALKVRETSDQNLATLRDLESRYGTATEQAAFSATAGEERLRIAEEFSALMSSGTLHSATNFPRDKKAVEPIEQELARLASQVESACHKIEKSAETGSSASE